MDLTYRDIPLPTWHPSSFGEVEWRCYRWVEKTLSPCQQGLPNLWEVLKEASLRWVAATQPGSPVDRQISVLPTSMTPPTMPFKQRISSARELTTQHPPLLGRPVLHSVTIKRRGTRMPEKRVRVRPASKVRRIVKAGHTVRAKDRMLKRIRVRLVRTPTR